MPEIKRIYLVLSILILVFLAYWLLFKPYIDRKSCNNLALDYSLTTGPGGEKGTQEGIESAITRKQLYDSEYGYCLHSKGIGF